MGEMLQAALDAFALAKRRFLRGEQVDMGSLSQELGVNRVTLYRWAGTRVETPVPLDDLACTAVRIVGSHVHRAAITGDEPDADRAARVLHALLR